MAQQSTSKAKAGGRAGSALRIGIIGCAGRMGQMLVRTVAANSRCVVAAGAERLGAPSIGKDVGLIAGLDAIGVSVKSDVEAVFAASDAVLEFTSPAASVQHAEVAAKLKRIHIIGTTGFEPVQLAALARAAKRATIVLAPNMSLGVNLLAQLVKRVAGVLDADWDIEIVEMHHRAKVDAPSGTALALGRAAAEGRAVALDQVARRGRDGITGARHRGDIGFAALRGGDVVGDHAVIFAADGERIELAHKASSRDIYARGALRAALWAQGKPPGLYSMNDVLGLGD